MKNNGLHSNVTGPPSIHFTASSVIIVIGNHNCRIFRNQEYSVFGNKEYIGFGNKGAEKMATRNAEICRIKILGNDTNPLFIKAYGLS
jgi:hypothetical protein